jgi:hypothetical protein
LSTAATLSVSGCGLLAHPAKASMKTATIAPMAPKRKRCITEVSVP